MSDEAAFSALLIWEEFSAGAQFPLAEPGVLLSILALACLIGQSWPQSAGRVTGAFVVSALIGVVAVRLGWTGEARQVVLLAAAFATAFVAAAVPARVQPAIVVFAAAGGFLTGAASTPALLPLRVSLPALAGALAGAVLALALLGYMAGRFRRRFGGAEAWIGLRIGAAWVAAISAMMLALRIAA